MPRAALVQSKDKDPSSMKRQRRLTRSARAQVLWAYTWVPWLPDKFKRLAEGPGPMRWCGLFFRAACSEGAIREDQRDVNGVLTCLQAILCGWFTVNHQWPLLDPASFNLTVVCLRHQRLCVCRRLNRKAIYTGYNVAGRRKGGVARTNDTKAYPASLWKSIPVRALELACLRADC